MSQDSRFSRDPLYDWYYSQQYPSPELPYHDQYDWYSSESFQYAQHRPVHVAGAWKVTIEGTRMEAYLYLRQPEPRRLVGRYSWSGGGSFDGEFKTNTEFEGWYTDRQNQGWVKMSFSNVNRQNQAWSFSGEFTRGPARRNWRPWSGRRVSVQ
jgi:hypothetical protein